MDPWLEFVLTAQRFALGAAVGIAGSAVRLLDPGRKVDMRTAWRLLALGAMCGGFSVFGVGTLSPEMQIIAVGFVGFGAEVVVKVAGEAVGPLARAVSRWTARRVGDREDDP